MFVSPDPKQSTTLYPTPYTLSLINFEGPLDLLLQLIERSELEITQISLGSVTSQYLEYINQLPDLDPSELNQFVELATKLILIKSLAILPGAPPPEVVDDAHELEAQLEQYQQYQKAAQYLKSILATGRRSWSGGPLQSPTNPPVLTPPNLDLGNLSEAFQAAIAKIPATDPETTMAPVVSLGDMIERIHLNLKQGFSIQLSQLWASAAHRLEALVLFLAVLELVKSGQARVDQSSQFEEITLSLV